jgi:hypothetical protein
MGSTTAQGWYLLTFLLGFTLTPAGLFALGWPISLLGLLLIALAFGGFRSIKEPASGPADKDRARMNPTVAARAANSF